MKINNKKFRQKHPVKQRTNKRTYMHNRIIPNLQKTVFHEAKSYTWKQYNQLPLNSTKNRGIIKKKIQIKRVPWEIDNIWNGDNYSQLIKEKYIMVFQRRQIYEMLFQKNGTTWSILQISQTLQKVFGNKPMVTYKRKKILASLGHFLQGSFSKNKQWIKIMQHNE